MNAPIDRALVAAYDAGQALLTRGIQSGTWTRDDQRELRHALRGATPDQAMEALKRLSREINDGHVHYQAYDSE